MDQVIHSLPTAAAAAAAAAAGDDDDAVCRWYWCDVGHTLAGWGVMYNNATAPYRRRRRNHCVPGAVSDPSS